MFGQFITKLVMIVGFALISASSIFSQEAANSQQCWQGTLDVGVAKLRLRFDIEELGNDKYKCTLISLDQGNAKIPVDVCTIANDQIVIKSNTLNLTFEGRYQNGKTKIAGKFAQAGKTFDLSLTPVDPPAVSRQIECWQGTMKAGSRSFDFQFRVLESNDKGRTVELDSFSESLGGVEVKSEFRADGVTFEIPLSQARFEGSYNDDQTQISGHWLQGGDKFPLKLAKVAPSDTRSVGPLKRPQNPKPPFAYNSKNVTFENLDSKITLAGTLTTPKGKGPFAAVVLITGSGPQDRDESLLGHKPFLVLADHLTQAGIAVLRYDERGVGKSTGQFDGCDSRCLSKDVEAAIDFLKTQPEIDATKIGLIGHSEGGYIGPMIAARRNDIDFLVMLAGPGVPGEQIIIDQTEKIGRADGTPEAVLTLNRRLQEAVFAAIRSADIQEVKNVIRRELNKFAESLSEDEKDNELVEKAQAEVTKMNYDPWLLFFLTYDPRPALKEVKCPVLVLSGAKDLQVTPSLNLPEIHKALQANANSQFEIHELPNLNHLFQNCETGSPSEYRQIEETFSPTAMEMISNWINRHTD